MKWFRDRQATQRQDKIPEVHYKAFPSLAAIASITNKPTNTSTDRQEYIAKTKVSQFTANCLGPHSQFSHLNHNDHWVKSV